MTDTLFLVSIQTADFLSLSYLLLIKYKHIEEAFYPKLKAMLEGEIAPQILEVLCESEKLNLQHIIKYDISILLDYYKQNAYLSNQIYVDHKTGKSYPFHEAVAQWKELYNPVKPEVPVPPKRKLVINKKKVTEERKKVLTATDKIKMCAKILKEGGDALTYLSSLDQIKGDKIALINSAPIPLPLFLESQMLLKQEGYDLSKYVLFFAPSMRMDIDALKHILQHDCKVNSLLKDGYFAIQNTVQETEQVTEKITLFQAHNIM